MEFEHFCSSSISGSLIDDLPQGCASSLMEAVHVQFNCWEHCKFISHIVKVSYSVFAMEPATDNHLVLDVNMSLYQNYVMLNHTGFIY